MKPALSLIALAALTVLLFAACVVNPATGNRQLSLITESQEIQMGAEANLEIADRMGLYADPALERVVEETGSLLAAHSERPDLPWTFRIVDDPAVNAFALPGGHIFVTRGILAHFNSRDELAGVLGHEIGHVTARHSVNQMSKAQLAGLGLGLGAALEPAVARYAGITSAGVGLLFLKFSRDDERQADDLGLRYMEKTGYDSQALVDVFRMLKASSGTGEGSSVPGWLSTHPSPDNREERLRLQLNNETGAGRSSPEPWLQQLDGLVYGPDPRQGFFRQSQFIHPEMAFTVRLPAGWGTFNQRRIAGARQDDNEAVVQLTLAAEDTPAAAADAFFEAPGARRGPSWRRTISGLPATTASFSAGEAGEEVRGMAAFIALDGRVIVLMGYAPQAQWPAWQDAITSSLASFRRLTAPADLNVQPRRLAVTRVSRATTLAAFHRANPSTISIEELERLNRLQSDSSLAPGTLIKRVVGGP